MALATLSDYRTLGQDAATDDDTVTALLDVAQGLLEIELGRVGLLDLGVHVETLDVWQGIVYPTAIPIDDATPGFVTSRKFKPTGASLVRWEQEGYGGVRGWACDRVRATVSYTGGYDTTTAPYPLKLAIVRMTKSLIPSLAGVLSQAPAGTKSLTIGDATITLARSLGSSAIPLDVLPLVQAYRASDASRT